MMREGERRRTARFPTRERILYPLWCLDADPNREFTQVRAKLELVESLEQILVRMRLERHEEPSARAKDARRETSRLYASLGPRLASVFFSHECGLENN